MSNCKYAHISIGTHVIVDTKGASCDACGSLEDVSDKPAIYQGHIMDACVMDYFQYITPITCVGCETKIVGLGAACGDSGLRWPFKVREEAEVEFVECVAEGEEQETRRLHRADNS